MSEHTPGPWKQRAGHPTDVEAEIGHVASCETVEDAVLIAVAPGMLAMLKEIVECNDRFRAQLPADWEGDPLDDQCAKAKAIIAAASRTTEE